MTLVKPISLKKGKSLKGKNTFNCCWKTTDKYRSVPFRDGLDRKWSTYKLDSANCAAGKKITFVFTCQNKAMRSGGGGVVVVGGLWGGGSVFCTPLLSDSFVSSSGPLWPCQPPVRTMTGLGGEKWDQSPAWRSFPWLLLTGGHERRVMGKEWMGWATSAAVSSMAAETVNTATAARMDGWAVES